MVNCNDLNVVLLEVIGKIVIVIIVIILFKLFRYVVVIWFMMRLGLF